MFMCCYYYYYHYYYYLAVGDSGTLVGHLLARSVGLHEVRLRLEDWRRADVRACPSPLGLQVTTDVFGLGVV